MSLTNKEAFAKWAPPDSPWSDWAKPALFATAPPPDPLSPDVVAPVEQPLPQVPEPRERVAVILELRGAEGVKVALALAARGYCPVPLYNTTFGPTAVVDVRPISDALRVGASLLESMRIRREAPPVFMLDASRMSPMVPPSAGRFDNRWLVFPQDFPSATYLRARGIDHALLVQESGTVRDDLAHVLLRWQQSGIALSIADPSTREPMRPLIVRKPRLYRRAWYRMLAILGLRRSNVGGFGAVIPIASSGGYG